MGELKATCPQVRKRVNSQHDADAYLDSHPQFDWMKDVLKSRPAQRWALFRAGD